MKYYSIHDKLAESWGPLFPAVNQDVAFRTFNKVLNDVDSKDDFELYQVADFDDKEGLITNNKQYKIDVESLLKHQENKLKISGK